MLANVSGMMYIYNDYKAKELKQTNSAANNTIKNDNLTQNTINNKETSLEKTMKYILSSMSP